MSDKMKLRRAEIMTEAAGLRKYPGTGYHDNDPLGPIKHPDPVGRRDAKLECHVIAFKETFEMYFVEPDAERVLKEVAEFYAVNADLLMESRLEQAQRTLIETAKEYASRSLVDGCFVCRSAQWNDLLAILHLRDIGVTTTAV